MEGGQGAREWERPKRAGPSRGGRNTRLRETEKGPGPWQISHGHQEKMPNWGNWTPLISDPDTLPHRATRASAPERAPAASVVCIVQGCMQLHIIYSYAASVLILCARSIARKKKKRAHKACRWTCHAFDRVKCCAALNRSRYRRPAVMQRRRRRRQRRWPQGARPLTARPRPRRRTWRRRRRRPRRGCCRSGRAPRAGR